MMGSEGSAKLEQLCGIVNNLKTDQNKTDDKSDNKKRGRRSNSL